MSLILNLNLHRDFFAQIAAGTDEIQRAEFRTRNCHRCIGHLLKTKRLRGGGA